MNPHKCRWTPWKALKSSSPLWSDGWRQRRTCKDCLASKYTEIPWPALPEEVSARRTIYRSPFSGGPVPKGANGFVAGDDGGYILVDFDGYDIVRCERVELK